MIVDLARIQEIKKELRKINREPLENIEWVNDGNHVEFSKEDLEKFKFMGLNNADINNAIGFTPK